MAKDVEAGGIVSPANLWGKPLPKTIHKKTKEEEKDTGMLPEDEIDSDVDAELEDVDPNDDELSEEETTEDVIDENEEEDSDADEDEDVPDEVDDEVDSDVESDEEESVPKKKRVATTMAAKKSMSDHVREEIEKRRAAGDSLRGVDIVNALVKKGVKVSPAQVSQLLKKAGISAKARGTHKTPKAATGEERSRAAVSTRKGHDQPRSTPKGKSASGGVIGLPVVRLKAAKDFIAACGDSYDEAFNALELHKQLHEVL